MNVRSAIRVGVIVGLSALAGETIADPVAPTEAELEALLHERAADVQRLQRGETSAALEELRRQIDHVSGQRDGHASGLFFHRDLEEAKREAQRTGRAILSLRLLGDLDEELSCANSRFFRVALYPDARVRSLLEERFVLHWSSERPAPHITIDMGDGRTLERTITGNSVHYVLDAQGRVIDAIPGLYAPDQFVVALNAALAMQARCAGPRIEDCLADAHRDAANAIGTRWAAISDGAPMPSVDAPTDIAPSAVAAMPITIGKAYIETPMLRLMGDVAPPPDREVWARYAIVENGTPDARIVGLLRLKMGLDQATATERARSLRATASADGLRNEVMMHARIHTWLAISPELRVQSTLNTRVYAELFLTPASDPWLGLRAPGLVDPMEGAR